MMAFERTENGTTVTVTKEDGLAEVNHAMMSGKREVRTMSSAGGRHSIEYKDGRKVLLVRVDVAEEVPAEAEDDAQWSTSGHKQLLHKFTEATADGRAVCNKRFRPREYGNGFNFRTKAERQADPYGYLYTFCPRCESK